MYLIVWMCGCVVWTIETDWKNCNLQNALTQKSTGINSRKTFIPYAEAFEGRIQQSVMVVI